MINRFTTNPAIKLFLFSFQVLFVELALIRWLGSNIIFLSFVSNLILLGSFLGIGIGFMLANSKVNLSRWAPVILGLLVFLVSVLPLNMILDNDGFNKLRAFTPTEPQYGSPIWLSLPIIFLLVTATLACIAHGLASAFKQFKPLVAYRLDILGALTGILIFTLLAFLQTPPIAWGLVVFSVFLVLFYKDWSSVTILTSLQLLAMFVMLGALTLESMTANFYWSPYYKISLKMNRNSQGHSITIYANDVIHQFVQPAQIIIDKLGFYTNPYVHKQTQAMDNVLIIGAGTGTDTAIALAFGAKHVDAVEIDPVIAKIGYLVNPDQIFKNPKVNLVVADGRSFLQQSPKLYDLIIFALPDSLTLVSGQSSLRLESYLFTEEAFTAAKQHLTPNGVFSMYNFYWQSWLIDRLAYTLSSVFKQSPCVDSTPLLGQLAVLTVGKNARAVGECNYYWNKPFAEEMTPATDDHPFLYLKTNTIPPLYIISLSLIFLVTIITMLAAKVSIKSVTDHGDLFFMGMAFLLLETKSVVAFSLLFGNTWLVNALVFFSILSFVYLAIETVLRFPKLSFQVLYGLLLTALVLQWLVPLNNLLALSFLPRFIVGTLLLISPVYLANLIFATQFQHEGQDSTVAFGVNMFGAIIGGLMEYSALITGYNFLLILIGVFYTCAFLLGRSKARVALRLPEKVFST